MDWDSAFYSQIMVVDIYCCIKFVNTKLAQVPPLCQLYLFCVFWWMFNISFHIVLCFYVCNDLFKPLTQFKQQFYSNSYLNTAFRDYILAAASSFCFYVML